MESEGSILDRKIVYRILDCTTLAILVLIGMKVGRPAMELLVSLMVPSMILLYFTWKTDSAWFRIIAFTALLYSWLYQSVVVTEGYYSLILFFIISIFLRPPLHFLRATVYSSWVVALYQFWQNRQVSASGWQFELLTTFADLGSYLPSVLLLGFLAGLCLNYFEKDYRSQNLYVIVMGILGFFIVAPFYLLLGGIRGLYQSLFEYWVTFLKVFKVRPKLVGQRLEHYLASTAIEDWKVIWSEVFKTNQNTIRVWFSDVKSYFGHFGFILAIYYSLFKLIGLVIVAVTCPIVNAIFSSLHFLVLACCNMIYQTLRHGYYYLDRFYRKIHKVEMICPTCYHQADLPVYVCAQCHTTHDDLVPNHFGVFKRKCSCGNKMPTSILNGRSKLDAQCPNCHSEYKGKESTPVVMTIMGGNMAGKTSFWTKGIHQLGQSTFKENGIFLEWLSFEEATNYGQLVQQVNAKQAPPMTGAMLPKAWTMQLKNDKWSRNKMLHLFDPAGEAFDRSDYMKKMEYLSYSDGKILVIDSTSMIPTNPSSFQYEHQTSGRVSPEELIDRLLLYYQEELGIKVHETIDTPLAIVFHKVDMGMQQREVKEVSATREFGNGSHEDCKQWLHANGFHNLLRKLDHQFTTYRFFTSSSFDNSDEVAPAKVMSWILNRSDKGLKLVEKGEG